MEVNIHNLIGSERGPRSVGRGPLWVLSWGGLCHHWQKGPHGTAGKRAPYGVGGEAGKPSSKLDGGTI